MIRGKSFTIHAVAVESTKKPGKISLRQFHGDRTADPMIDEINTGLRRAIEQLHPQPGTKVKIIVSLQVSEWDKV